MRNKLNIIVAATFVAGVACAQESQEFEDIVNQLSGEEAPMVSAEVAEQEVAVIVEESRSRFLDGKYAQAQQGFEQAVKIDPANKTARMYLRALLERDMRPSVKAMIEDVDAGWATDIAMRSYSLNENAIEEMGLAEDNAPVDVQDLFPQVAFPEGASAVFQPAMKMIFVRNTASNFNVLESILEATESLKDSEPSDQVEIEAKFVDVSEGTLEALGFQWDINGTLSTGDYSFDDGGGLLRNSLRGTATADDTSLPFTSTQNGMDQKDEGSNWTSFRLVDQFDTTAASTVLSSNGGTPMDLWISALDQSSGADVLSAPRITTKSGEEAMIRVGELHYFPEVYEASTSQGTLPHVNYQDFEEKMLGVELAVTPEVDDENITLSLNPTIRELIGWQSYTIAPADSVYNHRQGTIKAPYDHEEIIAQLPIYETRQVETEVVMRDGSTIGMGGLISEKVEAFEDKVPLLGDLPLVGRLFRSEGERSIKRNLLMFVTAKVVEPSGHIKTTRSFE